MKNFEKWEHFIMRNPAKCNAFAVVKGVPCTCEGVTICELCDFKKDGFDTLRTCAAHRIEWLYREYVEKPKLSKNEKKFVDLMSADVYIARDLAGSLFLHDTKPYKDEVQWISAAGCISMLNFEDVPFAFINWTDEMPWDVEMLSELEVEDE